MTTITNQNLPQTVGYVPEYSYLWHFIQNRPIKIQVVETNQAGQRVPRVIAVPSWVRLKGDQVFLVGLDLGNNGPKAAMFDEDGRIIVNHLQAVVKPVTDLAAGDVETVYEELIQRPKGHSAEQVADEAEDVSEGQTAPLLNRLIGVHNTQTEEEELEEISLGKEWINLKAVEAEGVSISKGSTRARLADNRYPRFLMYTIADLFEKAGYENGDYDILIAPGLPNEELVDGKLDPETEQALKEKLCNNKRWRIRITDQFQRVKQYNLKIVDMAPGPQSFAGFYAWQNRPDAQPAQTIISEILLEDLGANDLHELWIRMSFEPERGPNGETRTKVKVTATRERKGDGIILSIIQPFARKLKREFALGELDDAIAQAAYFERAITVGGFKEDLSNIVEDVQSEYGAKVITDVFKGPSRPRCFYIIQGGGNVLLRTGIVEKLQSLRRTPKTYLLLGPELASTLNAIGLLAILDLMCRYGV